MKPGRAAAWRPAARRLRHSIKGRLVALFLLFALATSLVFMAGLQRILQGGWQGYARPLVADYLDRLAADLGTPPDPARAAALVARLPIELRIEGPVVRWRSDGAAYGDADRSVDGKADGNADGNRAQPHGRDRWRHRDGDAQLDDWGLVRHSADGHRITFVLREPPDSLRPRLLGWATLALLLVLTLAAYAAVRRLLRPLEAIGAGVERYGRGEFGTPIVVPRQDELGALAGRVNEMATRLHGMLEAKRGLLLAISHELRSPLTRARVNAELVDEGAARDALLRDLAEMGALITSLLESERLTQGHAALHTEPVDLAALLAEVRDEVAPAAVLDIDPALVAVPAVQGVQGVQGVPGVQAVPAVQAVRAAQAVQADPTRLRLLLRNLLANAGRHAAEAAQPPRLFLRREADGRLAIGVRDFGPGVPATELPRLAEAFYRPDDARTREAGGVGLGLYLCRLVAEAHGGALRLVNAEPGLEAAMVWPAVTGAAAR